MTGKSKLNTKRRATAVMLVFVMVATLLICNIFRLDFLKYDYYKDKTFEQITTSSKLSADRGKIYDANMNVLAESCTVWRISVSTRDIRDKGRTDNVDYASIISSGMADILSLDKNTLYKKITNTSVLDVTIKQSASETEYDQTLKFIEKEGLYGLIYTEAKTSRYYPEGTLAAHLLGFTGSDNQGLYGIEYYYDDLLRGEDGYYVYAKDANGVTLDTQYVDYFPPTDGYSLVTTIDSYIQSQLEAVIERIRVNHGIENRVTGIVMESDTGAILGMATTSPFDPNDPFTLDEQSKKKLDQSGYLPGTDEYNAYKNNLMQIMWSNKAVSETYEPGSTFKIITVSSALDLGVTSVNSTFSCKGYMEIGGWRIRCHKTTGHGSGFDLAYGLQMSCNPCMMALSQRIGPSSFYNYVEKFGYFEKSGIDLPSEAETIFHKEGAMGQTELATASFGQRFKVSIINHLTAINAVANGGSLVTPYVVQSVIDADGNAISLRQPDIKRRVVSKEVADTVSKILIDGVNGDGGAKNAGVTGYDIAAKTGTSQKFDILDENGNSYLRISSTIAYAPKGDSGISVIIVADEPTSTVKYGSVVVAPYVSELMEALLPYLEYKSAAEDINVKVDNYVGMNINSVTDILSRSKVEYVVVGDGKTVLNQTPAAGDVMTAGLSKIILYTVKEESDEITVPSLIGLKADEAIKIATDAGLNIRIIGNGSASPSSMDIICEQSLSSGTRVKRGSVITIRSINQDHKD